ncbi:hypothetical protein LXL04_034152 [Taraxacum kok-saghyz]
MLMLPKHASSPSAPTCPLPGSRRLCRKLSKISELNSPLFPIWPHYPLAGILQKNTPKSNYPIFEPSLLVPYNTEASIVFSFFAASIDVGFVGLLLQHRQSASLARAVCFSITVDFSPLQSATTAQATFYAFIQTSKCFRNLLCSPTNISHNNQYMYEELQVLSPLVSTRQLFHTFASLYRGSFSHHAIFQISLKVMNSRNTTISEAALWENENTAEQEISMLPRAFLESSCWLELLGISAAVFVQVAGKERLGCFVAADVLCAAKDPIQPVFSIQWATWSEYAGEGAW